MNHSQNFVVFIALISSLLHLIIAKPPLSRSALRIFSGYFGPQKSIFISEVLLKTPPKRRCNEKTKIGKSLRFFGVLQGFLF